VLVTSNLLVTCTVTIRAPAPYAQEHQIYNLNTENCSSTTTRLNCMQPLEVTYRINAIKLYYLNLLRRLMLRLLLVTLGRDTGVASRPTPLPPTLDAPLPSCLVAYFLGGLFNTSFKACFLFFSSARIDLASSLSLFL
jgi:hypothetical protein